MQTTTIDPNLLQERERPQNNNGYRYVAENILPLTYNMDWMLMPMSSCRWQNRSNFQIGIRMMVEVLNKSNKITFSELKETILKGIFFT